MSTCLLDARRTWHETTKVPLGSDASNVDVVVKSTAGDIDTIVPLFVEQAIGRPANGRHLLTSDLVPTETFHRLANDALRGRDRFLQLAGGSPIRPEDPLSIFLGDDLLHVWREILYGQAIADALSDRSFQQLLWQPGVSSEGSATAEVFFQALTGGLAGRIPWQRLPGPPTRHSRSLRHRLGNAYRKGRNRLERLWARPLRPGRCIAIFSTNQWKRFMTTLDDLQGAFGADLSLWYLGRLNAPLEEAMAKRGIDLSQIQLPPVVDDDIKALFVRRHQRWREHGRHQMAEEMACPAIASPTLEGLFGSYFDFTFPRAYQWLRDLEAALEACRPELVVGSAAFTFTSALPLVAAQRCNIPSLALSHTYISGDHSPVPARYLACRNTFERQGFVDAFADDNSVLFCHNASDHLSYQVTGSAPLTNIGKTRRVALLTASPQFPTFVMPIHEIGPWVETIEALCKPPEDLQDIQWVFKFHPRFDLTHHLETFDCSDNVQVYPPTASLHELLADCWLAVLVNHVGGVGIDARLAGVPLVFLDSANYHYPKVDADSLQAVRLTSHEELWQRVRSLLEDGDRGYDDLLQQNRDFVAQRLTLANVSLSQCLEEDMPEIIGPR